MRESGLGTYSNGIRDAWKTCSVLIHSVSEKSVAHFIETCAPPASSRRSFDPNSSWETRAAKGRCEKMQAGNCNSGMSPTMTLIPWKVHLSNYCCSSIECNYQNGNHWYDENLFADHVCSSPCSRLLWLRLSLGSGLGSEGEWLDQF